MTLLLLRLVMLVVLALCPDEPAAAEPEVCAMGARAISSADYQTVPVELRSGECLRPNFDGYIVTAESGDHTVLAPLPDGDGRFVALQPGETSFSIVALPDCPYPCRMPEWRLRFTVIVTP